MRPLFEVLGRLPAREEVFVRHGLAAWVADEMAEAGVEVPPSVQAAARAQIASGLKVKRLTLSVLDALARAHIVPILLKGYGLATRLYPKQPLARPSSDVDLLVSPDELASSERVLAGMGLKLQSMPGVEDELEEHHHRSWAGHAGLVEVHFRLFSGFGARVFDGDPRRSSVYDDASVCGRSVDGLLDGRAVRWLGREDEFVYLATHAANHGFLRLSWLVDLQRYLELGPDLDWPSMLENARAAGLLAPFLAALELTQRVLDVTLPPAATEALRHSRRGRVHPFVFSAERVADARWSNGRIASFLLRLYLVDTPAQGVRHLWDGARRYWRQRSRGPGAKV